MKRNIAAQIIAAVGNVHRLTKRFQLKNMPVFRPLISPPDFPTIEAPLELNPLVSPHDFG